MTVADGSESGALGAGWSASLRRGTEAELRAWLDQALGWADEADRLALASFQRELHVTAKPDRTLVTQVDTAIEELIRDRVARRFPGHGVLGEEFAEDGPGRSVRWYVDPIDGTHNYVRGIPVFATLLAVERDGELQVGVVSAPALGSRWFARRGGGAWALDRLRSGSADTPRRITVSAVERLADAQVLYSSRTALRASGLAPGMDTLLAGVWRERGFGDFWSYALVAQGSAEACIETGMSAYDLAAPVIVVEEAGGRFSDLSGARTLTGGSAIATNGVLHPTILRALGGTNG